MFKKPFQSKSRTPLRTSDTRRLAQEVKSAHPSLDSDTPPVPSNLQTTKFVSHIGEKGQIYYEGPGNPLWIKAELSAGTQTLVPSIYSLWRFPTMLPVIWTWPRVVDKLTGGADLMVPGIIVPDGGLADLKKGDLVAIAVPGNLAPMAVGVLNFDTRGVQSLAGAKGKGVIVVHAYKDYLWAAGDKTPAPVIEEWNGAVPLQVSAVGSGPDNDDDDDDGEEGEWVVVGGQKPSTGSEPTRETSPSAEPEPAVLPEPEPTALDEAEEKKHESSVGPAEMDVLLMDALKQVMATELTAKTAPPHLPITSSTLYSQYMVPNVRAGVALDIKRSGYKKLAKFLKAAEKLGMLKLKDIRGESHVKSFDWAHKSLVEFKPYKVDRSAAANASPKETSRGQANAQGSIRVAELFKPSAGLRPLFDDVGAHTDSGYFSRQQARQVLEDYIKGRALVDERSRGREIRLDHRLCDALMSKEEYSKLDRFPRDKLHVRMIEKMTLYSRIEVPGADATIKIGRPPLVDVTCEKKMGNKVVTRIAGLEAYGIDAHAVAKELRVLCASSTTVDAVPGKKDRVAVGVQGHQVAAVLKLLEGKHGLPQKLVAVVDKTGKTKSKKGPQH